MSQVSIEIERLVASEIDLAEIVRSLDRLMERNAMDKGTYLTFFACEVDLQTQVVTYVNCGHPAPLLWNHQSGRFERLESNSLPVGFFSLAQQAPEPIIQPISYGDNLILFTDGLSEFGEKKNAMLGEKGIRRLVQEFVEKPGRETAERVFEKVSKLSPGELDDDILLVLLALHGETPTQGNGVSPVEQVREV